MKNLGTLEINTFYHSLVIEQLENNILIYNNKTGDSVQIHNDFINFCFTDGLSLREKFKTLVSVFCYYCDFDSKLFKTVFLEKQYLKAKIDLANVLQINNYSQLALLKESLIYAKFTIDKL